MPVSYEKSSTVVEAATMVTSTGAAVPISPSTNCGVTRYDPGTEFHGVETVCIGDDLGNDLTVGVDDEDRGGGDGLVGARDTLLHHWTHRPGGDGPGQVGGRGGIGSPGTGGHQNEERRAWSSYRWDAPAPLSVPRQLLNQVAQPADDNPYVNGGSGAPHHQLLALAAVIVASCGDALGGVGDLSHRVVYGDEVTTTTTLAPAESQALRLRGITDLIWTNDGTDATTAGLDQDSVITAVWLRGDKVNPFVQASRREIAIALPGIEFPQLAPEAVTHASSQLLYDQLTGNPGRIDRGGFWPLGGRAV